MSVFESKATIAKPIGEVYAFLAVMNNHGQLMPDNVIGWTSDADVASFEIQNITKLSLKISSRVADKEIVIIPAEKPPFDMELKWVLEEANGATTATFTITANLNMLMKMMASAPLQKLTENESQKLAEILG
ncbi:orotate phosphoribosyltransferase [Mucilaginibacter pedocola]|uniref:Orotate phosphoribosyltransferase n=1 Tax=Mucilaginibacter pedocola TaxID=1792845 RepID=A0A1S9PNV6_9SPHI|nr:orotate phosphoribosyltransferase [Mucilaginibacter pedocola]OOQ62258.1 orotate phosphoribosyltransferase [Mucilaginibacter pedocola]